MQRGFFKSECGAAPARKGGMALVVVLGLITLLIISSVAFVTNMRIERAGAANVRNTTMAHEAAKGALSYAIAAIDHDIGSKNFAAWDDWDNRTKKGQANETRRLTPYWDYHTGTDYSKPGADSGSYRLLRFWKDTLGSADHFIGGVGDHGNDAERRALAKIVNGNSARFLPPGARLRAYARRYQPGGSGEYFPSADTDVVAPEWVPLCSDPTNQNVVGRYSFLAFNTSGYLDLPAVCAEGDTPARGFGGKPSEIQPVPALLNPNKRRTSNAIGDFKVKNKGLNFENVAEITAFSKNRDASGGSIYGSVFDDGATFKALSFTPIERVPTNGWEAAASAVRNGFPRNKLCIAGDGSEDHIKALKNHKAAIIKAFMLSGLTQSSDFSLRGNIVDKACTGCSVCGNGAPAFTLPKGEVSEQAVWAYLGLLDYCDDDDDPAFDDDLKGYSRDLQQFARPVVEPAPLFNGFMATLRLYVEEKSKSVEVGTPDNPKKKEVFDGENYIAGVEFNGKVVFANRCAAEPGTVTFDDIQNDEIDGRMGLYFDGEMWDMFQDKLSSIDLNSRDRNIKKDPLQFDGDGLYMANEGKYFMDGPLTFFLPLVTNVMSYGSVISDPNALSEEQKDGRFLSFPSEIVVCAAGQSYNQDGEIAHRFPAIGDSYDYFYALDGAWLASYFGSGAEGRSFKHKQHNKQYYEESLGKVYSTAAKAAESGNPDYTLKRRVVNIIMWAEPLDPAFSCGAMAELPGSIDTGNNDFDPKPVFASHNANGGGDWKGLALAHAADYPELSFGANNLVKMMESSEEQNDNFKDFVADFTGDPDYFGGYFVTSADDTDGFQTGSSAFQRYFLESQECQDEFGGVIDGVSRSDGNFAADNPDSQFNSAFARGRANSGEPGLDSPGELGFLPVGPYATIRLFGYDEEKGMDKNGVNREVSLFNQVAGNKPYHPVLDLFAGRIDRTRGRVNLSSSDVLALASVFNAIPLDDSAQDSPADAVSRIKEGEAETLARALIYSFDNEFEDGRLKLSDLGHLFDSKSYYDGAPYPDDIDTMLKNRGDNSNSAREAIIRNSCGLFTTRGLDFTVIMRGEAFTPFFGKTDVKSELGTTLASRMAVAQIWRDTEPDENGKYPVFVHYFKIFDD